MAVIIQPPRTPGNITGTKNSDLIIGSLGGDVMDAGAGSDKVIGRAGDDVFIHRIGENVGSKDEYDGGLANDTLRLELTSQEWLRADVRADVTAFLAFLNPSLNRGRLFCDDDREFEFKSTRLEVRNIEKLEVYVEGVKIDLANRSVIARADTLSTNEDVAAASVELLANDVVPQRAASVRLLSGSAYGSAQLATSLAGATQSAVLTFTPGAAAQALKSGQTVTETIQYEVTDVFGVKSVASLSLTIVGRNDAAAITIDTSVTDDRTVVEAGGIANATAGDPTASGKLRVTDIDTAEAAFKVPTSLEGKYGTFKFNAATGAWTYALNQSKADALAAGEQASDTLVVTSLDGTASQSVAVAITGTNDAPTVSGAVQGSTTEDGARSTLNALANASDVDKGAVLKVVAPASLPAGVTFDATSQTFTLDPANAAFQSLAAGETTTVKVSYGVSDGTATTAATACWTVTGTNDAPTVSGAVTGAVTNRDGASTLDALANASDIDHGALLKVVAPTSLPDGVVYDGSTHSFTLDPTNAAYSGLPSGVSTTVTVSYGVSDGYTTTPASVSWTVTGANSAPDLVPNAPTSIAAAAGNLNGTNALDFDVTKLFTDRDGDTLTYKVDGLPNGFTFANGHIKQTDPMARDGVGDALVTVTANDGRGGITTAQFNLAVALTNTYASSQQAPLLGSITGSSLGDTVKVGDYAAVLDELEVDVRGGNNYVEFGSFAAALLANVVVSAGSGDDTVRFADQAGSLSGALTVNLGDGQDTASFGAYSASGGKVNVSAGRGSDRISFGENAGSNGTLIVGLGASDLAADTVTFDGRVTATVNEFEIGTDKLKFGSGAFGLQVIASGDDALITGNGVSVRVTGGAANGRVPVLTDFIDQAKIVTIGTPDTSVTEEGTGIAGDSSAGGQLKVIGADGQPSSFRAPANLDGTYGSFTFDTATGVWGYTLKQNFADKLQGGQHVTDSLTLVTADGSNSKTVVVDIAGSNDAPDIIPNASARLRAAAGNLNGAPAFDIPLNDLFFDRESNEITYTVDGLPKGFTFANGRITQTDPKALDGVGDTIVTITAEDGHGGKTVAQLDLAVALANSYVFILQSLPVDRKFFGSSLDDRIEFPIAGDNITIDAGEGNNSIIFGNSPANSYRTNIMAGGGDDVVQFGNQTAASRGSTLIDLGDGNNTVNIGALAAIGDGVVEVKTGRGSDQISFGLLAAVSLGRVAVSAGGGADQITFGDAAGTSGNLAIGLGANDQAADRLTFNGSVKATVNDFEIGTDKLRFGLDSFAFQVTASGDDALITGNGVNVRVTGGAANGRVPVLSDFIDQARVADVGTPDASVTEAGTGVAGDSFAGGTLSVIGADGKPSGFRAPVNLTGNYGTFTFNTTTGAWTYTLDQAKAGALLGGQHVTETLTLVTTDGTNSKTINVDVAGTDDSAVIGLPTNASVTEDGPTVNGRLIASGTISIEDSDAGQAKFTGATAAPGTLGSLVLSANGSYSYGVLNSDVQYLVTGQTKVDTFTLISADGTTKTIEFTINGVDEPGDKAIGVSLRSAPVLGKPPSDGDGALTLEQKAAYAKQLSDFYDKVDPVYSEDFVNEIAQILQKGVADILANPSAFFKGYTYGNDVNLLNTTLTNGFDQITFGDRAAGLTFPSTGGFVPGNVVVNALGGSDLIQFGDNAAAAGFSGQITVNAGSGNDRILFGLAAAFGASNSITVNADTGADQIFFKSGAGLGGGIVTVNFGTHDNARDVLTLQGFGVVTINDFEVGIDKLIAFAPLSLTQQGDDVVLSGINTSVLIHDVGTGHVLSDFVLGSDQLGIRDLALLA